jgi:hypothetical protein
MVGGCKGIFYKGVGEEYSLINERILKYKLKVYQKNFLDFMCGSPINIEVSSQDEKTKAGDEWNNLVRRSTNRGIIGLQKWNSSR